MGDVAACGKEEGREKLVVSDDNRICSEFSL